MQPLGLALADGGGERGERLRGGRTQQVGEAADVAARRLRAEVRADHEAGVAPVQLRDRAREHEDRQVDRHRRALGRRPLGRELLHGLLVEHDRQPPLAQGIDGDLAQPRVAPGRDGRLGGISGAAEARRRSQAALGVEQFEQRDLARGPVAARERPAVAVQPADRGRRAEPQQQLDGAGGGVGDRLPDATLERGARRRPATASPPAPARRAQPARSARVAPRAARAGRSRPTPPSPPAARRALRARPARRRSPPGAARRSGRARDASAAVAAA